MSDETIRVKRGKKVPPEHARYVNPAEVAVGRPRPPESDVSGQEGILDYMHCPWCGAINYVCETPSPTHTWCLCWHCGGMYSN